MKVTRHNYTALHHAFVLIEQDNGFHHYERIHGRDCDYAEREYIIPPPYRAMALIANAVLEVMTPDEVEVMCCGEQTEQDEVVARYDADGKVVDVLLGAFFDAWPIRTDTESEEITT